MPILILLGFFGAGWDADIGQAILLALGNRRFLLRFSMSGHYKDMVKIMYHWRIN